MKYGWYIFLFNIQNTWTAVILSPFPIGYTVGDRFQRINRDRAVSFVKNDIRYRWCQFSIIFDDRDRKVYPLYLISVINVSAIADIRYIHVRYTRVLLYFVSEWLYGGRSVIDGGRAKANGGSVGRAWSRTVSEKISGYHSNFTSALLFFFHSFFSRIRPYRCWNWVRGRNGGGRNPTTFSG